MRIALASPRIATSLDEGLEKVRAMMGEAAARRMPLQLYDLATRPSYPLRDITLASGFHSVLIVPLLGAERISKQ